MEPISSWTATSQYRLEKGTLLKEVLLKEYTLKIISSEFCLWIVAIWPSGAQTAFRAAYAANDHLEVANVKGDGPLEIILNGATIRIKVTVSLPESEEAVFRYTTTIMPVFDLLIPYWPRDIMPLFNDGRTQDTKGTIHAAQVGTRSGLLFFTTEEPQCGSVFYFQDLTSLNEYCQETKTSAGDLVGGAWPEIGMKLPVTSVEKPLRAGQEYTISDAFVLLSAVVPEDNYQMSQQFMNYLATVYLLIQRPDTQYHDWPDILSKGLSGL
ncbi:MAG: hypothetical protein ACLGH8_14595 [Bacteroidia bacterium]